MDNYQVPIYIRALAELAEMEAMKADNALRMFRGESPVYTEEDFMTVANNLHTLAREA